MSARANPRATGPTLTPAGSLAARPAGWQRGTPASPSPLDRLRQAALDARTMGRPVVRDLPVDLIEDVLREVRHLEQRVRAARIPQPSPTPSEPRP